MTRGRDWGPGTGDRGRRSPAVLATILLLVACTDPRARPVPPLLDVQFAPSLRVTSPGTIVGALYAYDEDGLERLVFSLVAADTLVLADSLIPLDGPVELDRTIDLLVPSGIAVGTPLRYAVRVRDFLDFSAADTVVFTVQTPL